MSSRLKNRPAWRLPVKRSGNRNAKPPAKRSSFGDFTPGNGRTQCAAINRAGKRCGCDALQGATCCNRHGGATMAYAASGKPLATTWALRSPRRALAKLGATVSGTVDGRPLPASPVDRGRMAELGVTVGSPASGLASGDPLKPKRRKG